MDSHYQQIYHKLLTTLGHVTEGGVISSGAHIGATAVPALGVQSPLDLMLVIEPFPLSDEALNALQMLGYGEPTTFEWGEGQRFVHEDGHRLYLHWWAHEAWNHHLLLRTYLRQDAAARQRFLSVKAAAVNEDEPQVWKARLFPTLIQEARRWWITHDNFATLHRLTADLTDLRQPWYISSGWALDLFLGEVTRYHEDVDVVLDRADQLALQQHLTERGWRLLTPLNGKLEPWPAHMRLELPRHQAHAHRLQENGENGFLDILLTDFIGDIWRYRREPSIVQSTARLIMTTTDGLRYLAPEAVLLFKSRNTGVRERSKDELDFERVLPMLGPDRRAWLRWALLVTQPNHAWLAHLS